MVSMETGFHRNDISLDSVDETKGYRKNGFGMLVLLVIFDGMTIIIAGVRRETEGSQYMEKGNVCEDQES